MVATRPGYVWNSGTSTWDVIGSSPILAGGTTGQVLAKSSGTDYDVAWTSLGTWTDWVPTLAQGTSTDITKTIGYARYAQVGKLVVAMCDLACTSTGQSGQPVTVSLPVTGVINRLVGTGHVIDASVANYPATVWAYSSTVVAFSRSDQGWTDFVGASPSMALANGDYVRVHVTYEAA